MINGRCWVVVVQHVIKLLGELKINSISKSFPTHQTKCSISNLTSVALFFHCRVPLAVASNLVQGNHYPGRLVAHRSRARNQGVMESVPATVVEDISTVTALQHQIISTVAAVERAKGDDVIRVDQQPEDVTEMDVTGLGSGSDSDQRLLLGSGGGGGGTAGIGVIAATKEGSVGRKTGSKQKKIFIRNSTTTQHTTVDLQTGATTTTTSGSGEKRKERPMVTIVTIGGQEPSTLGSGGQKEADEDKIDILAHL